MDPLLIKMADARADVHSRESVQCLLRRINSNISMYEENKEPEVLDCLILLVDLLIYHLNQLAVHENIVSFVADAFAALSKLREESDRLNGSSCGVQKSCEEVGVSPRRPRYCIEKEQLEHLLDLNLDSPTIANILGVSLKTIRHRVTEYDIRVRECYSDITDARLEEAISDLKDLYPICGYHVMDGLLRQRGIRVTQSRLRDILHHTDPHGTMVMCSDLVHRRKYHVPGAQSIWHIDGMQKLIRWGIVVHGGIDGYSRLIVYLDCAANNKSSTVFNLFHLAITQYGIPSRVRCDKGEENIQVGMFMLNHPLRGTGRGSVIVGRSIHNQRIERLWRDVYQGVIKLYHGLFYYLEDTGLLDPNNEVHLFSLHYVYLPRIRRHLDTWKKAWNEHPFRTESGATPLQLWTAGLVSASNSDRCRFDDDSPFLNQETLNRYGIDWDGPPPLDLSDSNDVVIPPIECPISSNELAELHSLYDPLSECCDFAINLYLDVLEFVSNQVL